MGTIHVMEAIRVTRSVKVAVMITTDKCYENKEQLQGYKESDPFGGYDPYSSSRVLVRLQFNHGGRVSLIQKIMVRNILFHLLQLGLAM